MVALNRKLLVSVVVNTYLQLASVSWRLALRLGRGWMSILYGDCLNFENTEKVWDIERALIFQWGIYYRDVT